MKSKTTKLWIAGGIMAAAFMTATTLQTDYITADAKAKKQEASNHIKEIMGDYDKAICLGHSISWKPVSSERLDSKALKEAEPEIYEKYVKKSISRRFTIK